MTANRSQRALLSCCTGPYYPTHSLLNTLILGLDGRTLDDSTLAEYLAVRFYAKLGGQASPVGPATARVLAGSSGGSVRGLRDTGACIGSLLNQTPAAKR